jgi:hypothetical protein
VSHWLNNFLKVVCYIMSNLFSTLLYVIKHLMLNIINNLLSHLKIFIKVFSFMFEYLYSFTGALNKVRKTNISLKHILKYKLNSEGPQTFALTELLNKPLLSMRFHYFGKIHPVTSRLTSIIKCMRNTLIEGFPGRLSAKSILHVMMINLT